MDPSGRGIDQLLREEVTSKLGCAKDACLSPRQMVLISLRTLLTNTIANVNRGIEVTRYMHR